MTGGETDRRRGTGQQSLIRDVIHSTRFGIEATANLLLIFYQLYSNSIALFTWALFKQGLLESSIIILYHIKSESKQHQSKNAVVILDALAPFSMRWRHSRSLK